jgi:cytochrome c biogenesis protein CcmG/thiol:disulfide interchange protein DsbE
MLRLLQIICAIVLCLVSIGSRSADAAGNTTLPIGASAPTISEPTAAGTFDSTTSAKPYVVEFFAVWCPHCQREVPVVNQLAHVDGNRVDIIAIPASPFGFDQSSTLQQADIDRFAHDFNVDYRIGFDGFFSASYDYGVASFPTFYFVNADRHVTAVETGEVPFEKLQADVETSLQR